MYIKCTEHSFRSSTQLYPTAEAEHFLNLQANKRMDHLGERRKNKFIQRFFTSLFI